MLATSLGSNLPQVVIIEDMNGSSLTRGPLVGVHSNFFGTEIVARRQGEAEKVHRNAPRYWLSEE